MTSTHTHTADVTAEDAQSPATTSRTPVMLGALYALIVANGVQIAAGLAQLELSPPQAVMPLLGATVAIGVAAVPLVKSSVRAGYLAGIVFCALSLIGMGPHKVFLDDGLTIAPLALTGFAFEIVFVREAVRALRGRR